MASSRTFWGRMDSLRTYWNRGMARRAISGLYFNTDIGPVPTPPGPELTSSKMLRKSSRTRSRVTRGRRAIVCSSRMSVQDAARWAGAQGRGIILAVEEKVTDYTRQTTWWLRSLRCLVSTLGHLLLAPGII